jgi:tetratricopeptide (TPR) repeat protein
VRANRSIVGIRAVAFLLFASNLIILTLQYILPYWSHKQFFSRLIPFVSTLAVFPYDFYQSYLVDQWAAHIGWIVFVMICAWGIFERRQWARMSFIVLGIIHCIILAMIVIMKLNQWYVIMLQYCFRLYFNLVAVGSYVGFLTMIEVRSQFVSDFICNKVIFVMKKFLGQHAPLANAKGYYNLALAYRHLGRYPEATHFLKRAIEEEPRKTEFLFETGHTYFMMKNWPESVKLFRQTLALDPIHLQAYMFLGRALLSQGCAPEAVEAFQKASHIRAAENEIYYYLGIAYQKAGRMTEAEQSFQEAVKRGYKTADLYWQLGNIQMDHLEKYADAESAFIKVVRLEPQNIQAHFSLGLAAVKLSKYKEAIRFLKDTLSLSPDHTQAHYQLGFSYVMIEDFDSAKREYQFLLKADKELAETLKLLLK